MCVRLQIQAINRMLPDTLNILQQIMKTLDIETEWQQVLIDHRIDWVGRILTTKDRIYQYLTKKKIPSCLDQTYIKISSIDTYTKPPLARDPPTSRLT